MLTQKEVKSLKPGEYPNHVLRMKFGKKLGTPVVLRFRKNELDEQGNPIFEDRQIIGNRQQARFMKRNPLKELPNYEKSKFQSNRFVNKDKQARNGFKQVLDFIKNFFGLLNKPYAAA